MAQTWAPTSISSLNDGSLPTSLQDLSRKAVPACQFSRPAGLHLSRPMGTRHPAPQLLQQAKQPPATSSSCHVALGVETGTLARLFGKVAKSALASFSQLSDPCLGRSECRECEDSQAHAGRTCSGTYLLVALEQGIVSFSEHLLKSLSWAKPFAHCFLFAYFIVIGLIGS